MAAKYFARINVGNELEDRIQELLKALGDGAQEYYATIRTGVLNLIMHHLDSYMINELHGHPMNRNVYEGDISKIDVSIVSDQRIKARYVCTFSGEMPSNDSMELKVTLSSNSTPVEELKGKFLELLKKAGNDYERGKQYQMALERANS